MSKITSDGLARSGTGCFIAVCVPYIMPTVGVEGTNWQNDASHVIPQAAVDCTFLALFSEFNRPILNMQTTDALM